VHPNRGIGVDGEAALSESLDRLRGLDPTVNRTASVRRISSWENNADYFEKGDPAMRKTNTVDCARRLRVFKIGQRTATYRCECPHDLS